ncbi:MAG: PEP-CTERM sorting domain-containing protein [Phycisphaerae bacterium]
MRTRILFLTLLAVAVSAAPVFAGDANAIWKGDSSDDFADTANYRDETGTAITTLADADVVIAETGFGDPNSLPLQIGSNLTDGNGIASITFNDQFTGPLSIAGNGSDLRIYQGITNANAAIVELNNLDDVEFANADGDNTVTIDGGVGLTLDADVDPLADGRVMNFDGSVSLKRFQNNRSDVVLGGTGRLTVFGGKSDLQGTTTIQDSLTLILAGTSDNLMNVAMVFNGSSSLKLDADDQLGNNDLTLNNTASFDINGYTDSIGKSTITMNGDSRIYLNGGDFQAHSHWSTLAMNDTAKVELGSTGTFAIGRVRMAEGTSIVGTGATLQITHSEGDDGLHMTDATIDLGTGLLETPSSFDGRGDWLVFNNADSGVGSYVKAGQIHWAGDKELRIEDDANNDFELTIEGQITGGQKLKKYGPGTVLLKAGAAQSDVRFEPHGGTIAFDSNQTMELGDYDIWPREAQSWLKYTGATPTSLDEVDIKMSKYWYIGIDGGAGLTMDQIHAQRDGRRLDIEGNVTLDRISDNKKDFTIGGNGTLTLLENSDFRNDGLEIVNGATVIVATAEGSNKAFDDKGFSILDNATVRLTQNEQLHDNKVIWGIDANATFDVNGVTETIDGIDDLEGTILLGGGTLNADFINQIGGSQDFSDGNVNVGDYYLEGGTVVAGTGTNITNLALGGTFDLGGNNVTLGGNLDLNGGSLVYNGGVLTVTGTTNINSGTLVYNPTQLVLGSGMFIGEDGTLDLNGNAYTGTFNGEGTVDLNGADVEITGGTMAYSIIDSAGTAPAIDITGKVRVTNFVQTQEFNVLASDGWIDLAADPATAGGTWNFDTGTTISGNATELGALDSAPSGTFNFTDGMTIGFEQATTLPSILSGLTDLTYGVNQTHGGVSLTLGGAGDWVGMKGLDGFKTFGSLHDGNTVTISGDTFISDVQMQSKLVGGTGYTVTVAEGTRFEPMDPNNTFDADIKINAGAELTLITDTDTETPGFETTIQNVDKLILDGGRVQHWVWGSSPEIETMYVADQEYNVVGDDSTISLYRMQQMGIQAGNLTGSGDVTFTNGTYTLLGDNPYSGEATVDSGAVLISKDAGSLDGTIDPNGVYVADFALSQAEVDKIVDGANGALGLTTAYASGTALDMGSKKDLFVGAYEAMTLDGDVTAANWTVDGNSFAAYNFGGAGAVLTVADDLDDFGALATDVNVKGTVIFTGNAGYTGSLNVIDGVAGFGAVGATPGSGDIEVGVDVDGVVGNEIPDLLLSGIDATDYVGAGRDVYLTGGNVGWVGGQTITALNSASSEVGQYTATEGGVQVLGLGAASDSGTIDFAAGLLITDGDFDTDGNTELVKVVKKGGSSLDLRGMANTYSGGTDHVGGALLVDGGTTLGSGQYTFADGVTIETTAGETASAGSSVQTFSKESQLYITGGGEMVFDSTARVAGGDADNWGFIIDSDSTLTIDQTPRPNSKYGGNVRFEGTGGTLNVLDDPAIETPLFTSRGVGYFRGLAVEAGAVANIHVEANRAVVFRGNSGSEDIAIDGEVVKTGDGALYMANTQGGGNNDWSTGKMTVLGGTLMLGGEDKMNNKSDSGSWSGHTTGFESDQNVLTFGDGTALQWFFGYNAWYMGEINFGDGVTLTGYKGFNIAAADGNAPGLSYDGQVIIASSNDGKNNSNVFLARSAGADIDVAAGSSILLQDPGSELRVDANAIDPLTDSETGVSVAVINNGYRLDINNDGDYNDNGESAGYFGITRGSSKIASLSGTGETVVADGASLQVEGSAAQRQITAAGNFTAGATSVDYLAVEPSGVLSIGALTVAKAARIEGQLTTPSIDANELTLGDGVAISLTADGGFNSVQALTVGAGSSIEMYGELSKIEMFDANEAEAAQRIADGVLIDMTGNPDMALGYTDVDDHSLAMVTYEGDASLDGKVSLADLSALAGNWNSTTATWDEGDFTGDGKVSLADLSALAGNWNAGVSGVGNVAVPEPTTLCLLALGSLAAIRRRRK